MRKLTQREQQVLDLLMQFPVAKSVPKFERGGCKSNSDKWIADQLGLAVDTVKDLVDRLAITFDIQRKGPFHPRIRIVYLEAIRRGLIKELA